MVMGMTATLTLVLVDHGKVLDEYLKKTLVTEQDILHSVRQNQGLKRMDQIKYAVLENSGGISIIPIEPNVEEMLDRRIEAALRRIFPDKSK